MKRTLIALVTVGVLAGGGYYGYQAWQPASAAQVTYQTTPISIGSVEQLVVSAGQLSPRDEVEIGAQVSGQITEVLVDYNQQVEAGQVLARIDASSFEARVAQAQADVNASEASVAVQQAQLTQVRIDRDRAKQELARYQTLQKQGHVSVELVDQADSAYRQAISRVEAQLAQINLSNAQLQQRQAALQQAEVELSQTVIRSPIDGIVLSRDVEPGQTVASSLSAPVLFSLARDLSEMEIIASVDESDIGALAEGQQVRFTVDAYPERQFRGRVQQIRKSAQESQGVVTYPVVVAANNPGDILLPGMTADLEFLIARADNSLRVSNQALRFGDSQQVTATRQGGGNDGGGARGSLSNRLLDQLDLTDEQRDAFRQQMQAMRSSASSNPLGGSGFPPRRDPNAMNRMLQKILTPEQMSQYRQLQEQRNSGQSSVGQLALYQADGSVEVVRVRLGISDGSFTVVESEALEGANAIIRQR